MRRAGGAPLRVAALQGAAAWLSWLHTDEVHRIWLTLHTMVWTDVAFRTLTAFMSNEENALNNPLIEKALVKGHLATRVLAIRRLVEDSSKDRISLRTLLKDLRRHRNLFTRENHVCCDGTPYDYQVLRKARFVENAGTPGKGVPRGGPKDDTLSEALHFQFDKLIGIDDPTKRSREDCLPACLLKTMEIWLNNSGATELEKWSHAYLAHAGGPNERARLTDAIVTVDKITDLIRNLARVAQAMSLFVCGGGREGAVMPTAPFDQFEKLNNPILHDRDEGGRATCGIGDASTGTAVWTRSRTSWSGHPRKRAGFDRDAGQTRILEPLVHRLASVVDADRARFGAVGQRREEIGQLGVPMLGHEPLDVGAPAPAARLA